MVSLPSELLNALPDDVQLERSRYRADPLADNTVSRILGPWPTTPAERKQQQQRLAAVTRLFTTWQDNQSLVDWRPQATDLPPDVAQALADYVREGQKLPEWADVARVQLAESLFMEHGVLSCILLFCASLPECYVVPDLAAVLQTTSQLTAHTEYRVRATAAMVFPVMTDEGLMGEHGSGIAQILKVRLIHATIRYQILHGSPQAVLGIQSATGSIAATPGVQADTNMYQALSCMGWDFKERGLPCNQEELAYTLLTFSYVFMRGLRKLGVQLRPLDEDAYLHAWNVVGHILGVERALMADSMEEAAVLFERLQTRGRKRQIRPDARPALAKALINTMSAALPGWITSSFPQLMTQHLCGPVTSQDLGLRSRVPWLVETAFRALLATVQGLAGLWPGSSSMNSPLHKLGRSVMAKLLLDQTKPLQLPGTLQDRVKNVLDHWDRHMKRKN